MFYLVETATIRTENVLSDRTIKDYFSEFSKKNLTDVEVVEGHGENVIIALDSTYYPEIAMTKIKRGHDVESGKPYSEMEIHGDISTVEKFANQFAVDYGASVGFGLNSENSARYPDVPLTPAGQAKEQERLVAQFKEAGLTEAEAQESVKEAYSTKALQVKNDKVTPASLSMSL